MKFERLKTVLLIILVISSIVLTANKWFDEKLWPEGYNFFSGIKNWFSDSNSQEHVFDANEEVLRPAKIIMNNSGDHVLYTKSSQEYNKLLHDIKAILKSAFSQEHYENTTSSEWNSTLKSKSCYFSYPVIYNADYFSSQLQTEYNGDSKYLKEFLLSGDSRIPSAAYLYMRDALSNDIQKVKINCEIDEINKLISTAVSSSNNINYYSFELNFDSEKDSSVEQPILIDPDVLIKISDSKIPVIYEKNCFIDISDNPTLYSDILSCFQYSTSSIRKYVESDNSTVFVENYSTIKMRSNGTLEYKSVDNTKGFLLDNSSLNSCINDCISFADQVTGCFNTNGTMYYEISSDMQDITSKTFKLTFDYYINDNKIVIPRDQYDLSHAIEIEVNNGKITSYTQIFKSFYNSDQSVNCTSAITAIDALQTDRNYISDKISDIFIAYKYDVDQAVWIPSWHIENSKGDVSIVIPQ